MTPIASVVVPAHNEEAVIERTLDALLAGAEPGELEIVVACNGCTDGTTDLVRATAARHPGASIQVLDLQVAGKARALAAADAHCQAFPRVFLDADVVLDVAAIRATVATLADGVLAASPRLTVDLARCPRRVRSYYGIWLQLPVLQRNYVGSGCYALSEAGRRRLGCFPDVIADDQLVRTSFADHERATVPGAAFVVHPPRTLGGLVRRGVRVRAGNVALRSENAPVRSASSGGHRALLQRLGRQPRSWPGLAVYIGVHVTVRALARRRLVMGDARTWTRDETARAA